MELPMKDRHEAGQWLAGELSAYRDRDDVLVLGLPRGGIPVAYEVAISLHAPLDAYIVRKLGVPGHEELAMGAIATGDVHILNDEIVHEAGVSQDAIEAVVASEQRELHRRERLYRGSQPPPDVHDHTVILVDDGLATGTTMRAAVQAVTQMTPKHLIVAVPVAAPSTCKSFEPIVDRIVCGATPERFHALGLWYEDFAPTSDEEVRTLLARAAERPNIPTPARPQPVDSSDDSSSSTSGGASRLNDEAQPEHRERHVIGRA